MNLHRLIGRRETGLQWRNWSTTGKRNSSYNGEIGQEGRNWVMSKDRGETEATKEKLDLIGETGS